MTGASTPPEDAARDRANVAAFTQRLAHLTGLDIALGQGHDVNFLVLFMNSAEREAFADQVRAQLPRLRAGGDVGAARHAARHLLHRLRLLRARPARRSIPPSSC